MNKTKTYKGKEYLEETVVKKRYKEHYDMELEMNEIEEKDLVQRLEMTRAKIVEIKDKLKSFNSVAVDPEQGPDPMS